MTGDLETGGVYLVYREGDVEPVIDEASRERMKQMFRELVDPTVRFPAGGKLEKLHGGIPKNIWVVDKEGD